MNVRGSRLAWLVVLSTMVGSLLLMHGVAPPGSHGHSAHDTAGDHHLAETAPVGGSATADDGTCPECLLGHLMTACAAVLAAAGGLALAARTLARARSGGVRLAMPRQLAALVAAAPPPEPAWVRLAVMRC